MQLRKNSNVIVFYDYAERVKFLLIINFMSTRLYHFKVLSPVTFNDSINKRIVINLI